MVSPNMNKTSLLRLYLILTGFYGVLGFIYLLIIPRENKGGLLLGLSSIRLATLAAILIICLGIALILYLSWRNLNWQVKVIRFIDRILERWIFYVCACSFSIFVLILGIYYFLLFTRLTDTYMLAYFSRMAPLVGWITAISAQTPLILRFWKFGFQPAKRNNQRQSVAIFAFILLSIAALVIFIAQTKMGLIRDKDVGLGWGDPGAPLLATQVFIACFISISLSLFYFGGKYLYLIDCWQKSKYYRLSLDLLIFIILWGATAWLWSSEPLRPSYFAPMPRLPNLESYPYSYASNYDSSAYSLLTGNGLGGVVRRPLYSVFLSLLHLIGGKSNFDYAATLQTIILAIFPALIFLLASKVHNRTSGLAVAIMILFRERNSIALSGIANVSHARLLMSDLPTAVGVVLFTLVLILYLQKKGRYGQYSLLAGGILGLLLLVRLQTILLIFPFLVLSILFFWKVPHLWLKYTFFFGMGILIAIIPWLWRNYQLTGRVVFEETGMVSNLVQRYSPSSAESNILNIPGETVEENSNRMLENTSSFILENPGTVINFVLSHFLHNQIVSVLSLPANYPLSDHINEMYGRLPYWDKTPPQLWQDCCSLMAYATKELPYWKGWNGVLIPVSFFPILLNIILISIGITVSIKKNIFVGLIPLLVSLSYSLSCGLIRSSGWRYILPADWVYFLFFGIGMISVLTWVASFFVGERFFSQTETDGMLLSSANTNLDRKTQILYMAIIGGLIFIFGASIPISEQLFHKQIRQQTPSEYLASLPSQEFSKLGLDEKSIADFLRLKGGKAIFGSGLYPKFFLAGENEPWFSSWSGTNIRQVNQLEFLLLGEGRKSVVLPLESGAIHFPHDSNVLVLGCEKPNYFEAKALVFLDNPVDIVLSTNPSPWDCSLTTN